MCFKRANLTYSAKKHKPYLGKLAEIHALFANNTALVKMEDDVELKLPLDCMNRDGVSNLIRRGADSKWPKEAVKKHEDEMKQQLRKLQRQNPQTSDEDSESESPSDQSSEDSRRKK